MPHQHRLRRRVSEGIRGVVTFAAKRISQRAAGKHSAAQPLIHGKPWLVTQPRFRTWLPAGLALLMTGLTGFVAWSVASRLPTVLADTRALATQVKTLEQQLHAPTASPEQQEASEMAIGNLRDRENSVQQQRSQLNEKVAGLQMELENTTQREEELKEQADAEKQKLEAHRQQHSEALGRDIVIHPGPPAVYDAGPEPVNKVYPSWFSYHLIRGAYRKQWNAWRQAKAACDAFNAFQSATGVELVELQGKAESLNRQIKGFEKKLSDLNAQATELARQLAHYTEAPWDLWDDLNEKRKQLARTSLARTMFWVLDLPTLASCVITTAIAYSRMFLITGRFGQRQLARSKP